MIRKVINENEDKIELRDVYATCVKTLIQEIPNSFASSIHSVLKMAIDGIKSKR
jgi:hypothetical protein